MPYVPPPKTIMMQVIENLNNRIVPPFIPPDSFMTPEIVNGVISAMNSNDNSKCYLFFSHSQYYPEIDKGLYIYYFPFDLPSHFERVSHDFVFDSTNTFIYLGKQRDYERFGDSYRLAYDKGFEPYVGKNSMGLYETIATKKDNPLNPLNIKSFVMNGYPSKISLHKAFGFKMPDDGSLDYNNPFYNWKFTTGSHINYNSVSYAPLQIKMFKAMQTTGLILKPAEGQETLPYHNIPLYYCDPHYGYYDNYYDVFPFSGGGFDDKMNPLINGFCLACDFQVKWFTETEFWISLKYKIVYSDKRPKVYDPTLCCLAQCFGITE